MHYEGEWGYEEHGVSCSKRCAELPWRYDLDRAERLLAARPPGEAAGAETARIREEAARWRAALDALWRACGSLWSGMGDGDRGKSLIPERIVPPWHEAIAAAPAAMAREGVP